MNPKSVASIVLSAWLGVSAWASEATWPMEPMTPHLDDKPSLQRGAVLFANYCMGCHSLKYQRYERTADDLEVPHDLFLQNLVFTGQKIGALMENAMPKEAAKAWFGAAPPDLTMVAKARDPVWLYNYLKTFYLDPTRPLGVNNKVFPNVAMPNALYELQGVQREACIQVPKLAENGGEMRDPLRPGVRITEEKCGQLVVDQGSGRYDAAAFDQAVKDIVNFLYYVAEPVRAERERLGVYVILFLIILFVFARLLGREYEKEIH
jgi:cytochrome c1